MKQTLSFCVTLFLLASPVFSQERETIDTVLRRRLGDAELSMLFNGDSLEDAVRWQQKFSARLNELLGPTTPPKCWDTVVEAREQLADHTRYRLRLKAEGVPDLPIYLLIPNGNAEMPRAAVVAVHGHGEFGHHVVAGRRDMAGVAEAINKANYDYGLQFTRRGYVVACPCLVPFGDRVDRDKYKSDPCAVTFVRMMALGRVPIAENIRDIRWAVSLLHSRPEVAKDRIGCAGLSYGGRMTMMATALEPRIKVAAISGALNLLQERCLLRYSCGMQIIPGLLKYGDFSEIGSLIAPRPCVWEMGAGDGLIVKNGWDETFKARLEKIYGAYGARDQLHYDHFEGAHRWNGKVAFTLFDNMLRGAKGKPGTTEKTTQREVAGGPKHKRPDDRRLAKPRSTDGSTFPMQPVSDAERWPVRCQEIRTRILVAAGLHPMPKRSPLNAVVHGKVDRDDYTVERVIFESFPGHYVTGSLYRPKAPAGRRRPAVLSPHGHWKEGRFHDHGLERVRKEIAAGAERFEAGGRHVIQARCVQLARMGCVVFVYDMEGFADSVQLQHAAGPRPKGPDGKGYLFFSPRAELHGHTPFGLQTWNSIRALDFIRTLEDVDPDRIGVTGGSGGGTQSMILGAVDDRIAVSMPAVMVSSGAQGGCTCENAQYLRIGQGNVDIAAATAPRPLGLICANDWTRALKADGHSELEALYKLLGCPDRYEAHFHFEFGHNYNSVNRQHMYHFMNRHLKLGLPEPIVERDYVPLDVATEATVWTEVHPKPAGDDVGQPHERKLTAEWTRATAAALKAVGEEERRAVIAEAVTTMVGRSPADVGPLKWTARNDFDRADYRSTVGMLTVTQHGEQLPVLLVYPKRNWNREVVVRLTDTGKDGVLGADGAPTAAVAALIGKGSAVAAIDLFGQGDFVDDGNALETVRLITRGKGDRPHQRSACYHFGYNPPLSIQRVHDVMSLVEFLRRLDGKRKPERIQLAAVGKQVGPVALIARFMLGKRVHKVSVDAQGFAFDDVDRIDHPMFLPGILRYGGMDAL